MDELYELCSTEIPGTNYAKKSIQNFIRLMESSSIQQLDNFGLNKLIFCNIKVLSHCDEAVNNLKIKKKYKNYYASVIKWYFHLIKVFYSTRGDDQILLVLIDISHNENLWKWETLCKNIIGGLLNCGISEGKIIDALLDKATNEKTLTNDTKNILRIIFTRLENYYSTNDNDSDVIIKKLLSLYYMNLISNSDDKSIILMKGLEISILNFIKHLSNHQVFSIISNMCVWTLQEKLNNDEKVFEFSNIIECAAKFYETKFLESTLENGLFSLILNMISSLNPSVNLIGNRVFQYLIDRRGNKLQFHSIKIFFQYTYYNIKINDNYDKSDEEFLRKHRELIHDSLLQGIMNHSSLRLNMESMYCTICLIAVEIPCGFTAAALACLIMNIQDLTLEDLDINRLVSYHTHAFVLSIMTLLCWIHNAQIFYNYVNNIIMERAQWAPHLNPPLATNYDFAIHHVLWDKPELFFIDWEVRFGLWKCFRMGSDEEDYYDEKRKSIFH